MAKKSGKRKSASARSAAARKGWATRRRREKLSSLRQQAARADRKDPISRVVSKEAMRSLLTSAGLKIPKRTSYKRMEEIWLDFLGQQRMEVKTAKEHAARQEARALRAEQQTRNVEDMMPLVANKAIKETLVRLHEKLGDAPEGWVDDDYHVIRSRMSMAAQVGDPSEEAERLGAEFELHPREIFTIWLSP